jgi:ornithine carbamoyltransferase
MIDLIDPWSMPMLAVTAKSARHVLSITDFDGDNIRRIVDHAAAARAGRLTDFNPLRGRTIGIYFRGFSTRTRTSFTVAAHRLGAQTIHYGPQDLQIASGESIEDTAKVLSGFLDALVIRTNRDISEMKQFASQSRMPIINAMSACEHPTQAIADLLAIRESLGRFSGVHILYLGEGNNTAASLALAVSLIRGMRLTIVTPAGYGLQNNLLETAQVMSERNGSVVEQHHDAGNLPLKVDVVYTTRWQTMGEPKEDPNWKTKFQPYRVTSALMKRVSKAGTIFLHDLPAVRGEEVTDEVLDGSQSWAFVQADCKLFGAMGVLSWCAGAI